VAGSDTAKRIDRLFLTIYGRLPSEQERMNVESTLDQLVVSWQERFEEAKPQEPIVQRADWMAIASVCHTLLNSAEFIYID
jgi:hypothetical protein